LRDHGGCTGLRQAGRFQERGERALRARESLEGHFGIGPTRRDSRKTELALNALGYEREAGADTGADSVDLGGVVRTGAAIPHDGEHDQERNPRG
jgi:hypothetical protein